MSNRWKFEKISSIAKVNEKTIGRGYPFQSILYLETSDVTENIFNSPLEVNIEESASRAKRIVRDNDILISTVRPNLKHIGIINKAESNLIASTGFAVITPDLRKVVPYYLFAYLSTDGFTNYLVSIAEGQTSTYPAFNPNIIEKSEILLPPLEEQLKIATILSSYDILIENNNKQIAILEQIADQNYREWFVRMRFPGYEKIKFEKGVPKGWLKELGGFIKVIKGKSYTGEEINEDGLGKAFINLKSFNRGGGYRYDGIKFYTGKHHDNQIVKEGDIVMAVTDMTQDRAVVGRVARIPKTQYSEMVISLDTAKIVPDKKLPRSFIYATLRFGFFGNTIKEFANGSNVLHLKPELAYKMKSIIPDDIELMKKFDKIIEPYFNLIDNLNLENQNLKQTRDLLLPRLISGKLKVKDLGKGAKKK